MAQRALDQARELCPPEDPFYHKIDAAVGGAWWRRMRGWLHAVKEKLHG
jgi:hypothetical protein